MANLGILRGEFDLSICSLQICGLLNAQTTTRKLVEKMIDAINEMGAKGRTVAVGSYEEHVYKLVH